jgi:two-component system sensor histidine kinase PilS (NtrC family)
MLAALKQRVLSYLPPSTSSATLAEPQIRKLGLIYSVYRIIVSGFLMANSYAAVKNSDLHILPTLLQQLSLILYLLLSFTLLGLLYFASSQPQRQLTFGLAIDVIIFSLLLYSSGAPDLQITMLYMVVVAASFMLLRAGQALIVTLLAIIFVIYQQFFFAIANSMSLSNLGDALLMSMSFLAVGFLSWSISQRLVQVEKTAALQAQEVAKLNRINQEVVSKIVSGVMVIENKQVVLANQAACQLLHIDGYSSDDERSLEHLQQQLITLHPILRNWFLSLHDEISGTAKDPNNPINNSINAPTLQRPYPLTFIYELPPLASTGVVNKLRIELTPLKNNSQLLIIEDLRREQAGAQQLKLASLGQLTASIAHEIRNPLAAISQASQLLMEDLAEQEHQAQDSAALSDAHSAQWDGNRELYQMIFNQTKRVNHIIEDVLKLSRQQRPKFQQLDIAEWLATFLADHFVAQEVRLQANTSVSIYFDPQHLEQILINLINNGLRYSRQAQPQALVEVVVYSLDNDVIIDVLDEGKGVQAADLPRLFDPFFTTDTQGTGLGLYLSQAFTEANHARLLCVPEHEKTCFRLIIPQRQFVATDLNSTTLPNPT